MFVALDITFGKIEPGQIIARKYINHWDKLVLGLASPKVDYTHFSIAAYPADNDYMVFDVTVNGVLTLKRINTFKGQLARVYAVAGADPRKAIEKADSLMAEGMPYEGHSGWDYLFRLAPYMLGFWIKHGPRRIPWHGLPNVDSPTMMNCWEFVRRCYPDIIPADVAATAFAFETACRNGKLTLEQEGSI